MGRSCWSLWLLLQIALVGSSPADKTIRIGYLMQYMTRAGAINVAIEQAQNDGLLRDYNFRYYCSVYSSCIPRPTQMAFSDASVFGKTVLCILGFCELFFWGGWGRYRKTWVCVVSENTCIEFLLFWMHAIILRDENLTSTNLSVCRAYSYGS